MGLDGKTDWQRLPACLTHWMLQIPAIWSLYSPVFRGGIVTSSQAIARVIWKTRARAKYAIFHGQPHSPARAAAWAKVSAIADRFKSADKYLFSIPMWNFGIPYKLKHYIDLITQPGLTFSFSSTEGYKGLVTGKPAVVIYARGGEYQGGGASYDFQKPYFEMFLGFVGFTDIHSIVTEPTLGAPDAIEKSKAAAIDLARQTASRV